MDITTVGLDLAKNVFQVHGVDAAGDVIVRRRLRRARVCGFFAGLAPCLVGMEACGMARFWARELVALGHEVKIIPPSYVKAYVRRGKNDAADAAAICEAVGRPSMRFVPVKTENQQAALMAYRDFVRKAVRRSVLKWKAFQPEDIMAMAAEDGIPEADRQQVVDYIGNEYRGLHEGNVIRYRLRAEDLAGIRAE